MWDSLTLVICQIHNLYRIDGDFDFTCQASTSLIFVRVCNDYGEQLAANLSTYSTN
jgi:hypothetical protein